MPRKTTLLDSDGLLPWRYFVRALEAAFQLRVLLIAAAAVVLAALGDVLIVQAAGADAHTDLSLASPATDPITLARDSLQGPLRYWRSVTTPFWTAPFGFGAIALGLWRLAVGALAGGAIARLVVHRLVYRDPPGGLASLRHAVRGWPARAVSLAILLLLVVALLLPLAAHGWVFGVPVLGFLSALLLPIPLLFALGAAVLAVCVSLGWPLLIVSGAAERPDPFDATSRALAYATQRPFQLAAYVLTALAVAAPVGALAEIVAGATMQSSAGVLGSTIEPADATPARLTQFWLVHLLGRVPMVFYTAYFWSASVAVYLLLRRDVDGVQVDEMQE